MEEEIPSRIQTTKSRCDRALQICEQLAWVDVLASRLEIHAGEAMNLQALQQQEEELRQQGVH